MGYFYLIYSKYMQEIKFIIWLLWIIIFLLFIILYILSIINSIKYKVPQVCTFWSDFKVMINNLSKYNLEWKKIIDLWSWTWKVLRFFEKKFKMRVTWYEIDLWNIIISKIYNKIFWCNAEIINKNYFEEDLTKYDFIYVYLFPKLMDKIEEKIWKEAKKWTIIFSNAFRFANNKPIEILKNEKKEEEIYIYKI